MHKGLFEYVMMTLEPLSMLYLELQYGVLGRLELRINLALSML